MLRDLRRRFIFRSLSVIFTVVILTLNLRLLLRTWTNQDTVMDHHHDFTDDAQVEVFERTNMTAINTRSSPNTFRQFRFNTDLINVVGVQRGKRGFMTIGISSIKRRNNATYLMHTLSSIVNETTPKDRNDIVVVVFLADLDADFNGNATRQIVERYEHQIANGFIQIIRVSSDYYPPLKNLKRNFNDAPNRVSWRAKQIADYVLLLKYSHNLSDYYLHLEDDIICAKDYVTSIRQYVRDRNAATEKTRWAILQFSELGFIGKLFRSEDLDRLAIFFMTFYEEQPVDLLIDLFRQAMAQRTVYLRKPTLFQHIGRTSSFDLTRRNNLVDHFFDSKAKPWKGDNPPATILSTMSPWKENIADLAYSNDKGVFWAAKVVVGDVLFVIFRDEHLLSKVVVETGSFEHPSDRVENAALYVGFSVGKLNLGKPDDVCVNAAYVSTFVNGRTEVDSLEKRFKTSARCLKVVITKSQSNWIVFYQIAVFLAVH